MKDNPAPNEKDKDKDKKAQTAEKTRVFKGLCINCEHRFTCTLPRPESGVWYCEEYE